MPSKNGNQNRVYVVSVKHNNISCRDVAITFYDGEYVIAAS